MEVRNTRRLQLDFDTSYITAADGYLFTGIETEPKEVQVSGSTDVLEDLDKIEIPASALNIRDLDSKGRGCGGYYAISSGWSRIDRRECGAVVVTIGIEEEGSGRSDSSQSHCGEQPAGRTSVFLCIRKQPGD